MASEGKEISVEAASVSGSDVVQAESVFAMRIAASAAAAAIFWLVALVTSAQAGASADNYLSSLVGLQNRMGPASLAGITKGLAVVAMISPVIFILRAAAARGGNIPRMAPGLVVIGGILFAITSTIQPIMLVELSKNFATNSGLSFDEYKHLVQAGIPTLIGVGVFLGSVCLAFGVVIASLRAMKVGLFSRFIAMVGVVAGLGLLPPEIIGSFVGPGVVLFIFSVASWFLMVAALASNRWPAGRPPAWNDGEAHPWPTAAERREEALAAKAAKNNGKAA
jgi:hypothetical protein